MTDWIRLNQIQQTADAGEDHGPTPEPIEPGVVVGLIVSPYDVPDAVRGFQKNGNVFRIEFRYIDGKEPARSPVEVEQHLTAVYGKHSGRLLAIEVDTDGVGTKNIGLKITAEVPQEELREDMLRASLHEAMGVLSARQPNAAGRQVFEKTREAVAAREDTLLKQMLLPG